MILSVKTDQPRAELGLMKNNQIIDSYSWEAHRKLSLDIHSKIEKLLQKNNCRYSSLSAVIVFQGPGSFTGLRIGIALANALANGLGIPVAGAKGANWQKIAATKLIAGKASTAVFPYYGEPAKTTRPKK